MTFISYAQNFEDVMLWRALKHVENGFYIDVGANDPLVDSVTKVFYDRGWKGINIEPLPLHCADLREQRKRDITVQCAVGDESGEIKIWECDVRGWATASLDVVAAYIAGGYEGSYRKVAVRRLTEICEKYAQGDIHFLKIDVEGIEESVIRGMDFSQYRPWILVIEATKPNTTQESHEEWESLVLAADYLLAYCDGLNRFYVAREHSELLDQLHYPPNVFDEFIRTEQFSFELRATEAEAKATEAEAKATEAEAKATEAEAKATEAIQLLHGIYESRSWRVIFPLRWLSSQLRLLYQYVPIAKAKSLVIKISNLIRRLILNSPKITVFIIKVFGRYPRLRLFTKRLRGIDDVQVKARSFDSLSSIKIMNAMARSHEEKDNNDTVIFLKVEP